MKRLIIALTLGFAGAVVPAIAADSASSMHALIQDHCSECHNSVDWAGGLAMDTMDPDDIGSDPAVWEAAVRKLRGRLMPPPGKPQPAQSEIDAAVRSLENGLDQVAARDPNPGYVGLHRLNRREYARSIETMFGFPVDATTLLPKDVSSDGFDNVASVLKTSPAFLEQYVLAARRISRQAVGRPPAKPSTRAYRHNGVDQRAWVPGLPLGTRGGMVIEHYFPADGEYEFSIRDFHFGGSGYINRIDAPHRVVMVLDDARVFEQVVGGPEDLKLVDQTQAAGEAQLQARFDNIRLPVTAGVHRIGAAFVARSYAESDSQLQPIAMLPEMERYPEIPGIEISGPFNPTGVSETESRRRVFRCRPAKAADEEPCAREILAPLAQQAYRRPVSTEDLAAPMEFFRAARHAGDFEAGIEAGITAILTSTHFLYRVEATPGDAAPGADLALTDLELASRLAFFLWSQGPDDELLRVAAAGKLRSANELDRQIDRMLANPKSESLVTNFAFQWLNVAQLDAVKPDPVFYPDFDPDLREGFREELRLFLASVLLADRSVVDLLTDDYSFLNERLALQYKVPGVRGAQFRKVHLSDPNRFGLLGKGGVLMGTAYGNRTSPVLRGAWIMDNLIGTPPTAPPPGVETLMESEPGAPALTVRERMERHRQQQSCNACHGIIDPLGFALENFDVVGAWRDRDRDAGTLIDAHGALPDGQELNGPVQLRGVLTRDPQQFVQTLTEKLMVFALGRGLQYYDMPAIRQIVRDAQAADYRFSSIVKGIAASRAFQYERLIEDPEPVVSKVARSPGD